MGGDEAVKSTILSFLSKNNTGLVDFGNLMALVKDGNYDKAKSDIDQLISDGLIEEDELGFFTVTEKGDSGGGDEAVNDVILAEL